MHQWLLVLLIIAGAQGAVRNAAQGEPGFLENTEYVYTYESAATLLDNLNLTVQGEVRCAA